MKLNVGRAVVLLAAVVGLIGLSAAKGNAGNWRLVPGNRAGSLHLGSYPKGLPLAEADYGDAAMGHYIEMWVSKLRNRAGMPLDTLVTESLSNGPSGRPGVTLFYVRVTSPRFHDRHGLSTRSTFASIRRLYRRLQPTENKPAILSDDARGIAFEFATAHPAPTSRCIAISIYEKRGLTQFDASDVHQMVLDWLSEKKGKL